VVIEVEHPVLDEPQRERGHEGLGDAPCGKQRAIGDSLVCAGVRLAARAGPQSLAGDHEGGRDSRDSLFVTDAVERRLDAGTGRRVELVRLRTSRRTALVNL
jgi:hypothetical protein